MKNPHVRHTVLVTTVTNLRLDEASFSFLWYTQLQWFLSGYLHLPINRLLHFCIQQSSIDHLSYTPHHMSLIDSKQHCTGRCLLRVSCARIFLIVSQNADLRVITRELRCNRCWHNCLSVLNVSHWKELKNKIIKINIALRNYGTSMLASIRECFLLLSQLFSPISISTKLLTKLKCKAKIK